MAKKGKQSEHEAMVEAFLRSKGEDPAQFRASKSVSAMPSSVASGSAAEQGFDVVAQAAQRGTPLADMIGGTQYNEKFNALLRKAARKMGIPYEGGADILDLLESLQSRADNLGHPAATILRTNFDKLVELSDVADFDEKEALAVIRETPALAARVKKAAKDFDTPDEIADAVFADARKAAETAARDKTLIGGARAQAQAARMRAMGPRPMRPPPAWGAGEFLEGAVPDRKVLEAAWHEYVGDADDWQLRQAHNVGAQLGEDVYLEGMERSAEKFAPNVQSYLKDKEAAAASAKAAEEAATKAAPRGGMLGFLDDVLKSEKAGWTGAGAALKGGRPLAAAGRLLGGTFSGGLAASLGASALIQGIANPMLAANSMPSAPSVDELIVQQRAAEIQQRRIMEGLRTNPALQQALAKQLKTRQMVQTGMVPGEVMLGGDSSATPFENPEALASLLGM